MSFQGEIKASLGWRWNDGAVDDGRLDFLRLLDEGYGGGQAEAVWHLENQSLRAGEATTLDLTALGRVILGEIHTLALLSVKAVLVVNHAESLGGLLIGAAPADPWFEPLGGAAERVQVLPDGVMLLASRRQAWPVSGTARNLRIAASDADAVYSIAVLGCVHAAGSGSGT